MYGLNQINERGETCDATVIWVLKKIKEQVRSLRESWWDIGFEYWCKKQGNKFYQKGKCNSPMFSTETAYALVEVC